MKLRYTYEAREDLLKIWVFIARQNQTIADEVYDRIEGRCQNLSDYPKLGAARPEISEDARALVVERWLVLYRLINDAVQVVRIVDSARDLDKIDWPLE